MDSDPNPISSPPPELNPPPPVTPSSDQSTTPTSAMVESTGVLSELKGVGDEDLERPLADDQGNANLNSAVNAEVSGEITALPEKSEGLEEGGGVMVPMPVEEESTSLVDRGGVLGGGDVAPVAECRVSEGEGSVLPENPSLKLDSEDRDLVVGGEGEVPSGDSSDVVKEENPIEAKKEESLAEKPNDVSKEESLKESPIEISKEEENLAGNSELSREEAVAENSIEVNKEEAPSNPEEVVVGSVVNDSEENMVVSAEDEKLGEATVVVSEEAPTPIREEAVELKPVEPESAVAEANDIQNEKPEPLQSNGSISEVEKGDTFNVALAPVDSPMDEELTTEVDDKGTHANLSNDDQMAQENEKPVMETELVQNSDVDTGEESYDEDVEPLDSVAVDVKARDMPQISSLAINGEENSDPIEVEKLEDMEMPEVFGLADNGNNEPITDGVASMDFDVEEDDLNEVNEVGDVVSGRAPEVAANLETSDTAKQILQDVDGGSPSTSSGVGSSHDFSNQMDGQIVSDSDEEGETDEEGDEKELFDSAALAALLRAASGASSDGNVTITASDAARIFSVDRPAGLGSSMPTLRPGATRQLQSNLFNPSELAVVGDADNNMDEEEKKLHDKVEQIRVKFLRLVHRLGHSPEDTVAAQVLYRLGLAEGIKRGRQTNRTFSLETVKKKALQLEESGQEDLDFSCNILILGKSGVGKSATINSIFGEEVTTTNAFRHTTTHVKEIAGVVDGVKVRFIDTPGLSPSVMDQSSNKKILLSIKKYMKKCPPDIVLYVDRLDTQTRDFNDLPLLRSVVSTLGSSIWFNAIVALTHAACAPPDGPSGTALGYDVFVAQRSHVVQHSIRQAAGDMRLMNPVALVENHPSCRRNREGERVLPNGISWRPQLLLLSYSSKTLSEANSLLKLQDPSPGKLFGFRVRSPPLPYLLSSLLQSRPHPKLANDQGDNGDSDMDVGDLSDSDKEEEDEYEYDQLPPFKPLKKSQIEKLTKEQKNAYLDEYEYRVKLLQKKQWKDELRRLKEMKKRGKNTQNDVGYGDVPDDYDQDGAPAAVPVPMPDMVLPPTFDCDNSAYRYRFLEPTSQLLTRPVLDSQGWDHDCGYDGVSLEQNLALAGCFPAGVVVQITKDKKEFNIHMDSSIAAKHGENGSTLAGFDIQSIGKQLGYTLRSETKFKKLKKNKTAAGISMTFLGENVATGMKIEDQVLIGNRVSLLASTGAIRSQGDMAYGANLEARLREKDYPIGQDISTLGLSLMKWRGDLALGANLQSQFSVGRKSKAVVRVGLNNKRTGQISVRISSSEQLQIALLGILPLAISIYRSIWPGESYLTQ